MNKFVAVLTLFLVTVFTVQGIDHFETVVDPITDEVEHRYGFTDRVDLSHYITLNYTEGTGDFWLAFKKRGEYYPMGMAKVTIRVDKGKPLTFEGVMTEDHVFIMDSSVVWGLLDWLNYADVLAVRATDPDGEGWTIEMNMDGFDASVFEQFRGGR